MACTMSQPKSLELLRAERRKGRQKYSLERFAGDTAIGVWNLHKIERKALPPEPAELEAIVVALNRRGVPLGLAPVTAADIDVLPPRERRLGRPRKAEKGEEKARGARRQAGARVA
jgi:hypothetical protein